VWQLPVVILEGKQTPWAIVVETDREVRGGVNRQGRGKRRRRSEAGLEARDEESRIHVVEAHPSHPVSGRGGGLARASESLTDVSPRDGGTRDGRHSRPEGFIREAGRSVRHRRANISGPRSNSAALRGVSRGRAHPVWVSPDASAVLASRLEARSSERRRAGGEERAVSKASGRMTARSRTWSGAGLVPTPVQGDGGGDRGRREWRIDAAGELGEPQLTSGPFVSGHSITTTDSSVVGQWRATSRSGKGVAGRLRTARRTLLARVSPGHGDKGGSPQSIPRMESAGGDGKLMGGRPDSDRSALAGREEVRCPVWVPVGECKATRGNYPTAHRPGAATGGKTSRSIVKGRRRSREAERSATVRGIIL